MRVIEGKNLCHQHGDMRITVTVSFVWIYDKVTKICFVLRFYSAVSPVGSCRAQSLYLTTYLLGRLSPPSG